MAPPRKVSTEPGRTHPIHLRLPTDVFERVEAKAKAEGRPLNRIIINELAAHPTLAAQAKLGELVGHMETTLAQAGSRLTLAELSEDLLRAVDAAVAAPTDSLLRAQRDRMRVLRVAMLETARQAAENEREQLAAQIKLMERQIEAIEALPKSALQKDDLPALKAERARLQAAAVK